MANLNLKRSIIKTNDSNIALINYSSSAHFGFKTLEGEKGGLQEGFPPEANRISVKKKDKGESNKGGRTCCELRIMARKGRAIHWLTIGMMEWLKNGKTAHLGLHSQQVFRKEPVGILL